MEKRIVVKSDWETTDMPFKKAKFTLKRHFGESEISKLKCGHIPQEMEDKWFFYFENDTLYAHRSWSGACIYAVKFNFETDKHRVVVNRDKSQYSCKSKEDDLNQLNRLLDRWTQPEHDYYNEWPDETAGALRRSGRNK